jgi:Domain of unknown function (DUF4169)
MVLEGEQNGTLDTSRACIRTTRQLRASPRFVALCNRLMMGATMADIINLKRFKKRVARDASEQQAAANRAQFGRTKSERAVDERSAKRASEFLDQHQLNGEDAS